MIGYGNDDRARERTTTETRGGELFQSRELTTEQWTTTEQGDDDRAVGR